MRCSENILIIPKCLSVGDSTFSVRLFVNGMNGSSNNYNFVRDTSVLEGLLCVDSPVISDNSNDKMS